MQTVSRWVLVIGFAGVVVALAGCPPATPTPAPVSPESPTIDTPASSSSGGSAEVATSKTPAGGAGGSAGEGEEPGLAPLAGEPLIELEVEDHGTSVVSLPLGSTAPRPVLVATHGNYDRPDWTCSVWRDIVHDDGFVLCPRGVQRSDSSRNDPRFSYITNRHLEREIELGLAALREAYPEYVADAPYVYAGFSQGAIMGVPILGRRPEWFDRAVLIEGGFARWNRAGAEAYGAAGGQRVVFACGQWACDQGGKTTQRWLEPAGVKVKVLLAKGAGHTYTGEVHAMVEEAWGWVVSDDARWSAPPVSE